ncbi:unnamed protein product [Ranitomeya imitator]|uniref:Reverse transcriptase RNase H-like domain-containing protein n=1 Tax=Ranitomeya imitator TaxID=111125 RepID=A0ABN9LC62_9NEOB|nr:unnamed protein product [Ranitomeya imitator]
MVVQGQWEPFTTFSSNQRELLAVELAVKKFLIYLQGQHVRILSDNRVAVAYINRQGGTRSETLMQITDRLFQMAELNFLSLTALHIKGKENVAADFLSRNMLRQGEWSLNEDIFNLIVCRWGQPVVDLFATRNNRKVKLFCSLNPRENPLAVDAFLIKWDFPLAYAFPPLNLIPLVVRKIREDRAKVILIAPFWPRRTWFAWLKTMSVSVPWVLPEILNLLSQGPISHPQVAALHLTAWGLNGKVKKKMSSVEFRDEDESEGDFGFFGSGVRYRYTKRLTNDHDQRYDLAVIVVKIVKVELPCEEDQLVCSRSISVRKLIPESTVNCQSSKRKQALNTYETSSNDAEIIVKKRRLVPETFLSYMRNREPEPSTLELRNNSVPHSASSDEGDEMFNEITSSHKKPLYGISHKITEKRKSFYFGSHII